MLEGDAYWATLSYLAAVSVCNTSNGATGDKVMVEVGIHPRSGDDGIT